MRLIDADALKEALDEQMNNFEENCRDSVFDIIDNAPTIEAIPTELHEKIMDKTTGELLECQSNLRPQGEYSIEELRRWLISQGFSEGTADDKIESFQKLIKRIREEE